MDLQVMVVDDDPIFRMIAEALLKQAGMTDPAPLVCSNGCEALSQLEQATFEQKKFLLLLDINMPVLDGWGVLDSLKDFPHRENIFVAIVSSSVNKADRDRALSYDLVLDYLIKPLRREDLLTLKASNALAAFFVN